MQYPFLHISFSTQPLHITPPSKWELLLATEKASTSTRNEKGPKASSSKEKNSFEYMHKRWKDGELNLKKRVYVYIKEMIRPMPHTHTHTLLSCAAALCNPWQLSGQRQSEPVGMWKEKCEG